mgnify:FL=1
MPGVFSSPSVYPEGFNQGAVIQNLPIMLLLSKKAWFVDSNAAVRSDGSFDRPYAAVLTAIAKAAAGDLIIIKEAHTEALTATSFVCSVAGQIIIGLGSGSRIPTFTTTVVGGVVSVTAANVSISNIKLVCNYTGGSTQAILVDAAADGLTLDGIVCRDTVNTQEWLIHVSVATTVTDLTIQNCNFIGLIAGSMTNSILFAGTTSNLRLLNNHIDVDSADSTIDHDAGIATNALVAGNIVLNQDTTTAGYCIEFHASSTGHMIQNMCSYAKNDAPVYIGEAMFWLENYGGNTAGSSGELDPAAVAIP